MYTCVYTHLPTNCDYACPMDKPPKYPVPGGGTCSSLGERGLTIKFRAIQVVKYISHLL